MGCQGRSEQLQGTTVYLLAMNANSVRSHYLVNDVIQGIGTINGEADEKEIGLRVRKRAEAVIFFLSSGIPEAQFHILSVARVRVGDVVLKDRWDIFLRASVLAHVSEL